MEVGEPPHRFDLLVDTGSSWLVVEDCRCKEEGYCNNESRCLRTNHSTPEKEVVLMFGNGNVQVTVGSDDVRLAGTPVSSYMKQGLLLMVDHTVINSSPFEGILGLGLPRETVEVSVGSQTLDEVASPYFEDSFLNKAGISRFSVCFSDWRVDKHNGVLRLGTDPPETKYGITHNTKHWQLALNGVTVSNRLNLCTPTDGMEGQDSSCAAILDTGTTYILGPEDQVLTIFEELCEEWPRCKSNYTAIAKLGEDLDAKMSGHDKLEKEIKTNAIKSKVMQEKALLFQLLLHDCHDWYDEEVGLNEIPEIKFHIASRNGKEKILHFDPWSFIVMEKRKEIEIMYTSLMGIDEIPIGHRQTENDKWTCVPALAAMDYSTHSNGQGWILGQPLFYSYVVIFDTATNPPSISFNSQPCVQCDEDANPIDRFPELHKRSPRWPRHMHGEGFLPKKARKDLL